MILKENLFKWSGGFKSVKYRDNFYGCCGIHTFELTDDDIQSLKDGEILCNDMGEYAILIRRSKETE